MYDVLIIGAGPAGKAAAIQAAAFKLSVMVAAKDEPAHEEMAENVLLNNAVINQKFKEAVSSGVVLYKSSLTITGLDKNIVSFSAEDKSGEIFYARAVIIAVGFDSQKNMAYADFESITHKDFAGRIKVDANMATNIPGLFAAGDVTASFGLGAMLSASEGVKASLAAKEFLTNVSRSAK